MKVKKKAKWIRKAMKEFREYEERVVEFKACQDLEKLLGFDSELCIMPESFASKDQRGSSQLMGCREQGEG
jgi:hypothetical protein